MTTITKVLSFNFVAILLFTLIYFTLSKSGEEQFNGLDKTSTFLDHMYFAFTVQSTVGFGDIYPKSPVAKMVVMTQQSLLIVGLVELLSESTPSIVKNIIPNMGEKIM